MASGAASVLRYIRKTIRCDKSQRTGKLTHAARRFFEAGIRYRAAPAWRLALGSPAACMRPVLWSMKIITG